MSPCRAAREPLIILADEPTGSLDRENSRRVLELFRQIHERERVSLVLATHDTESAADASRSLRLVDGRLA